jgi:protein-L-isoaspartate(D-aspartate) O-methyltransferase
MTSDAEAAAFTLAREVMVDRHVRTADVTRNDLLNAMMQTPREAYLPKARRGQAYIGDNIPLDGGRCEMDARVFAKLAQALEPTTADLVLVIGSAGGYTATVLSRIVAAVVALEEDAKLAALAENAIESAGLDNVITRRGAHAEGCAKHAPYNAILVGFSVAKKPLSAWFDQLADGGRLVVVEQSDAMGRAMLYVKRDGVVGSRPLFDAAIAVAPGFEAEPRFVL